MSAIEIELLPAAASDDASLMARITGLTNEVYAVAEDGLWTDGASRTTPDEVAELTRAGEIAVARLDDRVVGCVRVQRLDEATGEFGMLVADPAHRGVGVGRELIRFAERACREDGLGWATASPGPEASTRRIRIWRRCWRRLRLRDLSGRRWPRTPPPSAPPSGRRRSAAGSCWPSCRP